MTRPAITRVDRQTSPLVEGRFYLVPTIRAKWINRLRDWPVIGPLHEDREIFGFELDHYHVDPRFLPPSLKAPWRAFDYPLHAYRGAPALPAPVIKRRKCIRSHVEYSPNPGRMLAPIRLLRSHYAGQQCIAGKGGWICPHRKASLGAIAPDADGAITCPLHGLRIDARSGVVLPGKT